MNGETQNEQVAQRRRGGRVLLTLALALLLIAALGLLTASSRTEAPPESAPVQTAQPIQTEASVQTAEPAPETGAEPSAAPEPTEPAETPEPTEPAEPEETPALPEALLKRYRRYGIKARTEIEEKLAALREEDPAWGELWSAIFERMFYVNQREPVPVTVPTGLPEDDSLCIVVFGFELYANGSMRSELVGRCEAALTIAQAYPNAYLALTGGATAAQKPKETEAGAMARYLTEKGVAEERLILEGDSRTTVDNALYLDAILTEQYPQIKTLVIVSSSYHVPMCRLLLEETALIDAYETGSQPYEVAAVMGYFVAEHSDWSAAPLLSDYVGSLAARKLNGK